MDVPTFVISPIWAAARSARRLHQRRRKMKLTVHQAYEVYALASWGHGTIEAGGENYYVNVTNASRDRDIVVTHIWFDTKPPVHIHDPDLPVRLRYSEPWETAIPISQVPAQPPEVFWLARCQLSPDDKIVKSRPRKNVPPFGTVPRGTAG